MRQNALRLFVIILTLLGIMSLAFVRALPVAAQNDAVVHAVFFFSPSCSHCHYVMTEVFPPLQEQYGKQLDIMYLDTTKTANYAIFTAAQDLYQPAFDGVPLLIVGDVDLIGSQEIPNQFPGLIESFLAEGGVGLPAIPGLENADPDDPGVINRPSLLECIQSDPVGNFLSILVLIGLVVVLFSVLEQKKWQLKLSNKVHPWIFLAVLAIGMIAALYLTYVEVTQTEAVCGPVGDCNAVQQSKYALIFGFLPMALFGLLGYLAVLATWLYEYWIKGEYAKWAPGVRFLLTLFGLAFSIGLTFLEPFVICATCAWCLTSAISMGLLALFSAGPGWRSPLLPKPKHRH